MGIPRAGLSGVSGLQNQPTAQVIDGSLNFNGSVSQSLSRTVGYGNRTKWTWSAWVKTDPDQVNGSGGFAPMFFGGEYNTNGYQTHIAFGGSGGTSGQLLFTHYSGSSYTTNLRSSGRFRDIGWYHIVVVFDSNNSTSGDRARVYVNGERVTSWSSETYPSSGGTTWINDGSKFHGIGKDDKSATENCFDGKMSQVYFIDGQALEPEYFGFTDPLTNTWKPKKAKITGPNGGQVWSSNVTLNSGSRGGGSGDAAMFDGILPSGYSVGGNFGGIAVTPSETSSSMTIDLGQTFTNVNVTIYPYFAASAATCKVDFGGGDIVTLTGSRLYFGAYDLGTHTFSSMTLTQVFVTGGGSNFGIGGIAIDGVMLINSTTNNFGPNGFYLPFDGNSPIGEDKSGKGNDWTPVNFGGSAGVDKATGALPILEGAGGAVAGVGVRTDANASNLTLALPLVGNAVDVSNRINSGSTTKTVSVSGDPASSTAQSNFYGASFYFDGSANTDYVSVADNDQLDVGSGDFTIECWAYVSGYPNTNPGLLSKRGGNGAAHWQLVLNRNGQIQFGDQATWSNYFGTSSGTTGDTIFKDNWHHIAITRTSGSVQAWYDGRKYGDAISNTTDFSTTANFSVGVGREDNHDPFQGYVNDVRVYKGVAKYTDSFVPASTNPDILPDTPSGVSGNSKLTKISDGAVSFDSSGDSLILPYSADWTLGTTWTIEAFIYLNAISNSYSVIASQHTGGSGGTKWMFAVAGTSNGTASYRKGLEWYSSGGQINSSGNPVIDVNRWYHVAVSSNSGTATLYVDGKSVGSGSVGTIPTASNSLYIGHNSQSGNELNGSISNLRIVKGTAVYSGNFTPPTAPLTEVTNTKLLCCQSNTQAGAAVTSPNMGGVNDGREWSHFTSASGGFNASYPKYFLFDGQTPADSNRAEASSNDVPINIDFSPAITVSSTISLWSGKSSTRYQINNSGSYTTYSDAVGSYKDISHSGSLSNIKILHGSAGQAAGISAIKIDGTQLQDPASVRGDAAATNFNPFNTDINTVRGQETGYPTLNPLDARSTVTLSGGNLVNGASSNTISNVRSTISLPSTGKYYFEYKNLVQASGYPAVGMAKESVSVDGNYNVSGSFVFRNIVSQSRRPGFEYDGNNHINMTPSATPLEPGDILSVLVDMDKLKAYVGINNILYGRSDATTMTVVSISDVNNGTNPAYELTSGEKYFAWASSYGTSATGEINFGQKPFKFPPPDGFQPLNTANTRPETIISRPDHYVDAVAYTGTGSARSITGLNFGTNPDLVWIKGRNFVSNGRLLDTVRGATKELYSAETTEETTQAQSLTSFDRDGFSLGTLSNVNQNTSTFVAWVWKAGGNKNTFNVDDVGYASAAAAGLDGGSITPTGASVGTKQGFSIIGYTGTNSNDSVAHGLLQAPNFVIIKDRDATQPWVVGHTSIGFTKYLWLNSQNGEATLSTVWQDTAPTSSVFTIGATAGVNASGDDYIAYLWHDVSGLQKFGSFIGNNSTDGAFVELGFRAKLIIYKVNQNGHNWMIFDSERDTDNPCNLSLRGNLTNAESGFSALDITSNGFKFRNTDTNPDGAQIIYMAWAEAPSVDLYGGGANAR